MDVVLNVGNILAFLLLDDRIPDDDKILIGISRLAYIEQRDPVHQAFINAATWHDAAYITGSEWQQTHSRSQIDSIFLQMMIAESHGNRNLERNAVILYLLVRKYGGSAWEGVE